MAITLKFLLIGSLSAQVTDNWISRTPVGNWFNGGNWNLERPPTNVDDAVVNNGTTAQVAPTPTPPPTTGTPGVVAAQGVEATAANLTVGATVPGSTVQVLSTDLHLSSITVGPQGTVRFSGAFIFVPTFLNNGVMLFDATNGQIVDVPIIGTGQLIMADPASLNLSGNNTYSGQTLISAGTLQAGSTTGLSPNSAFVVNSILDLNGFDNTIGSLSGTGTVLNNGAALATLTIGNDNTSTTFAGVLQDGSSALQILKTGTGTLTLTGSNTYSGGTAVSAGTLQAGSATAFSPNSEFTVNSILDLNGFNNTIGSLAGTGTVLNNGASAAALAVGNDNADSVFQGVIKDGSSALQLTKIGAGTLTLLGNNTYSGGTTISAGTLQLGNGGTTGSITGDLVNNGIVIFNRSDSVSFPGVISGSGSLVKEGSGSLTLPRTNPYTGTTTVNAGSLIVDGSIASEQTIVNQAGLLGGNGVIGGSLVNNGTINPGNSPGTLTVNNNFVQNQNGTLQIEIAGLGASQHDLLAVNGHVTLGGTLHLVRLGNFNLQIGDHITFIQAGNGISGNFNKIQNDFATANATLVGVSVKVLPGSLQLEATQGSFAETPGVAITRNQHAVAEALDSAAGDPRAAALFAFLNSEPLANLPHDLDLIAPAQISSINATAVSIGKVQTSNLGQRLTSIRGGSTGFSSTGFAISGGTMSFSEGFAGVSGPEGKSGPTTAAMAPTPSNRWGVFLTGLGEFTNVSSDANAAGYNVDTGGFTFGVDYRLTPWLAIGLTGGYAHTNVYPDGGGRIDVNGGKVGLYATAFANGFYLDTAVSGGPSGYDTKRAALQGDANGSTDGVDINVLVAGGYDWKKGNLTIGPTASFQFSYVSLNGFTETGSLAPLTFPDQNNESWRTAFGAKASYEWKIKNVTVIPEVRAAWQHEFGSTAYAVVANFASEAGNSFTVNGPDIGRDSLLIGAGATIIWNDRVSTYLYYDGEVARTNYDSHNVSGGFRISF